MTGSGSSSRRSASLRCWADSVRFLMEHGGRWARPIIVAALAEGIASVVVMMPVPLSYFSPVVGGLPGAMALGMEPTYYWDGLDAEARRWLIANTQPGRTVQFATFPTSWLYLRQIGELPRLWISEVSRTAAMVRGPESTRGFLERQPGSSPPAVVPRSRSRSSASLSSGSFRTASSIGSGCGDPARLINNRVSITPNDARGRLRGSRGGQDGDLIPESDTVVAADRCQGPTVG